MKIIGGLFYSLFVSSKPVVAQFISAMGFSSRNQRSALHCKVKKVDKKLEQHGVLLQEIHDCMFASHCGLRDCIWEVEAHVQLTHWSIHVTLNEHCYPQQLKTIFAELHRHQRMHQSRNKWLVAQLLQKVK